MTTLYWLALVLGGGLALLSLLGDILGFDHGGDVSADVSADISGDVSGELSHEAGDHDGMTILSLRSATYFLFAFGAVGVLLTWAWGGQRWLPAMLLAVGTGLGAATFAVRLFHWVARTGSGELPHDSSLVGLTGEMVLPFTHGNGKVLVARAGRELELMARPFEPEATDTEHWRNVIIVEVVEGTALVSPLDEESSESLLPPADTEPQP